MSLDDRVKSYIKGVKANLTPVDTMKSSKQRRRIDENG